MKEAKGSPTLRLCTSSNLQPLSARQQRHLQPCGPRRQRGAAICCPGLGGMSALHSSTSGTHNCNHQSMMEAKGSPTLRLCTSSNLQPLPARQQRHLQPCGPRHQHGAAACCLGLGGMSVLRSGTSGNHNCNHQSMMEAKGSPTLRLCTSSNLQPLPAQQQRHLQPCGPRHQRGAAACCPGLGG